MFFLETFRQTRCADKLKLRMFDVPLCICNGTDPVDIESQRYNDVFQFFHLPPTDRNLTSFNEASQSKTDRRRS